MGAGTICLHTDYPISLLALKAGLPFPAHAAFSGLQPSLARRRTICGLAATYAYFVARPFPLCPAAVGFY
jgi:hypothetical protein